MAGNGADNEAEHLHDLVQRSEPADAVEVEEAETVDPPPMQGAADRRNFTGWVLLWLLFGFLISNGLIGTLKQEKKAEKQYFAEQLTLRQAVLGKRVASMGPSVGSLTDTFAQVMKELEDDAKSNPTAARIYLAAQGEVPQRPNAAVLSVLLRSKEAEDRALARLYASEKLTPAAAEGLAAEIKRDDFSSQLAKVQAREKAGVEESGRDALVPVWKAFAVVVAILVLLAVCALGIVMWVLFIAFRSTGQVKPLGFPTGPLTPAFADRLAIRAAQILGIYLLLGIVGAYLRAKGLHSAAASLIPSIGVLVFVLMIQKVPVAGRLITLSDIGVNKDRFGKMVAWGACGYFAELPLTLLMGVVGQKIFSFLPPPEHPASTMLQNRPDIFVVVSVLVFGAMIAPFWEEIVFRGLMFPSFSKATWGPVAGAVITSLIFAAIHPQGLSTWLALGSVAVVGCVLAYHTKSLVPSITMHALHNLSLLLGSLLIF